MIPEMYVEQWRDYEHAYEFVIDSIIKKIPDTIC